MSSKQRIPEDYSRALGEIQEKKPAPRRRRRTTTQVGSSKAPMSELEHIRDELENPAPRANLASGVATFAAVIGAAGAIVAVLKPLWGDHAPPISGTDLLLIFSAGGGALTQIVTFLLSLKGSVHQQRAVRYANEMIKDCKEEEDEAESRAPRKRIVAPAEEAEYEVAEETEEETARGASASQE